MQWKHLARSAHIAGSLFLATLLLASCATAPPAGTRQKSVAAWQADLSYAYYANDQVRYVAALTGLARQWPDALQSFKPDEVVRAFGSGWKLKAQPAAMRDFYDAMYSAKWTYYGVDPPLHAEYIRLLMESGDLTKAREVARRLNSPSGALRLKVDLRYDILVQAEPDSFDVAALAVRQVADWERTVQRLPRALPVWIQLMNAYLDAGQYRKALAAANDLLAARAAVGPGKQLFEDETDVNWVYGYRARAYRGLGDWSAAQRDYQTAAALLEHGHLNVSNVLNLAAFHAAQGQGQAALTVLKSLGESISGYGRMVEHGARHVAALSTGDAAAARKSLAYIRKHQEDVPGLLVEELAREQRFDEAAEVFTALLADPKTRGAALLAAQEYPEGPMLPAEVEMKQRYRQLFLRPEVRAAIDKVGRIEQVPVPL